MATVWFAHHALLGHETANLGLLVWEGSDIRYFPVVGESRGEGVASMVRRATDRDGLLEYLLERGGGGYQSISTPESIEASSLLRAARLVAEATSIRFDVPAPVSPRCSRCGGKEGLCLVIYRYSADSPSGRVLVHCPGCRAPFAGHLITAIPIGDLTAKRFVGLYEEGLTESDPRTATSIAFGEDDLDVARAAAAAMRNRPPEEL